MRLDYLVSHSTGLSRKAVRSLLKAGRITVNGLPVSRAAYQLAASDQVCLDQDRLALPAHRYLMLNKPAGVVSASRDGEHATVVDLVAPALRRDLHPAGRLDRDTTGLVLLTSDGAWSHRITAPSSKLEKCYRVGLAAPLTDEDAQRIRAGLLLRGEQRPTAPARLEAAADQQWRLWITEGRYHQVKRMFGALGNRVVSLHREAIGPLQLDTALAPGEYRALTEMELDALSGVWE